VLAHAEIVIGAPDGDLAGVVRIVAIDGAGELPGDALEIGKNAVAFLLPQRVDGILEYPAVIHYCCTLLLVPAAALSVLNRLRGCVRALVWLTRHEPDLNGCPAALT
jgi:hypothetical protein